MIIFPWIETGRRTPLSSHAAAPKENWDQQPHSLPCSAEAPSEVEEEAEALGAPLPDANLKYA